MQIRSLFLDDGQVVGIGTHDELLKNCEVYQEIHYSQYQKGRKNGHKDSINLSFGVHGTAKSMQK